MFGPSYIQVLIIDLDKAAYRYAAFEFESQYHIVTFGILFSVLLHVLILPAGPFHCFPISFLMTENIGNVFLGFIRLRSHCNINKCTFSTFFTIDDLKANFLLSHTKQEHKSNMKNCLYIVPALFAVAAASNIRGDAFDADLDVKDLFALPDAQDQQPSGESSCPFDGSAGFFNVGVKIAGPAPSKLFCKKTILTQIGEMINEKLGEVGVGDKLAITTFVAGVCQDPETVTSAGPNRELFQSNFSWGGPGVSSNCDVNPCSIFVRSILTQTVTTELPGLLH